MELGLLLDMAVGNGPDRVAVTDVDGTNLTLGQLNDLAHAAAARFQAEGASRVGYLATNDRALPICLFGSALAGIPFVPFNYRLSDEQLRDVLHRDEGLVVVTDPKGIEHVNALGIDRTIPIAEIREPAAGTPAASQVIGDPDSVAVVLYTSGTTSAPKAALLRHRNLTAYIFNTVEFGSASESDAIIVSVPPYHIAGMSTILSNMYTGRRIVYLDPFKADRWLELVEAQGVTNAMVVPTMLSRIVEALDGKVANVPTLRSVAYGGAKMPLAVIERALELFPDVDFINAYGLTETSSTITVLGPDEHRAAIASADPAVRARLGSAGKPVPGIELRINDDDGNPVGPGVTGDVMVRGEQVSGEYKGASGVDDEGWFATHDRGRIDDEGYLFIEGRSDDIIIRGGENIAPDEIEDVLYRHPAVQEAAVVGIPDPEWGQSIAAAVVVSDPAVTPEDLRTWCKDHLRSSKTPDVVEIRDELPQTATGKILRRVVRDSLTPTS